MLPLGLLRIAHGHAVASQSCGWKLYGREQMGKDVSSLTVDSREHVLEVIGISGTPNLMPNSAVGCNRKEV